jgi:hypothetical protein
MLRSSLSPERLEIYDTYHAAYRKAHPDVRAYADRRSNKRLRLTNTYSLMRQRIAGKHGSPAKVALYFGLKLLSKEAFLLWADAQPDFHRIFAAWVEAGFPYKLSPSIDRIDPSGGYEEGNMRWLTLSDNASLKRNVRSKRIYSEDERAARRLATKEYQRRYHKTYIRPVRDRGLSP